MTAQTLRLTVKGMTCGHCEKAVTRAIQQVDGAVVHKAAHAVRNHHHAQRAQQRFGIGRTAWHGKGPPLRIGTQAGRVTGQSGRAVVLHIKGHRQQPDAGIGRILCHGTLRLLRQWAHGQGCGVVVVLHDLNLALRYADDVLLLAGGRVTAAGPAHAVLTPACIARHWGVGCTPVRDGEGMPQLLFH